MIKVDETHAKPQEENQFSPSHQEAYNKTTRILKTALVHLAEIHRDTEIKNK